MKILKSLKIILSLTAALVLCSPASGKPLSPEEAYQRLNEGGARHLPSMMHKPVLVKTFNTRQNTPAVYMFFDENSSNTLFLSADDKSPALLGYSDNGSNSAEALSPSLEWWLSTYADQIEYMNGHNFENLSSTTEYISFADQDLEPIEPLLTTRWNQDTPFNNLCPMLNNRRCVTGCVATAMAQILNYFKYPERANGMISYRPNGFRETLKMVLGAEDLDWDNMLNVYRAGTYTDEQAHAVAYLMQACAYSVEMMFSPIASGAYTTDIPGALVKYFDYDNSVEYVSRDFFTLDDWSRRIYDNIKHVGPVLYGGVSEEGGHEFVCDGYAGDGYFHFNWGWGGLSDGYFLLDALNPMEQGIGGALGGFHFNQEMLLNIRPRTEENVATPASFVLYGPLEGTVEGDMLYVGGEEDNYIGEAMGKKAYFSVGFIIENTQDPSDIQYYMSDAQDIELEPRYALLFKYTATHDEAIQVALNDLDLKPGVEYKFTLASLDLNSNQEVLQPVRVSSGEPNYLMVTLGDDGYSVRNIGAANLIVDHFLVPSTMYLEELNHIEANVYNDSDLQTTKLLFFAALNDKNRITILSDFFLKTFDPHTLTEINDDMRFLLNNPNNPFSEGIYKVCLVDGDLNVYTEMVDVMFLLNKDAGVDFNFSDASDTESYTVTDISGRQLLQDAPVSALKSLSKGLYIINGKKTMIR